ncbi:MAG: hypothetical protein R6U58_14405 [Bacteroidales bacterium]
MKTQEILFSRLNKYEMNAIRGGTNTGGQTPVDEDILLPDPEPDPDPEEQD